MAKPSNKKLDEVSLNILLKTKIQLFSKETHITLFAKIITETYFSSSFNKKQDIFRPCSKTKKQLWGEICKSVFQNDKKYTTSRLIVKYLHFYCSIVLNKLLVFSWTYKQDLNVIVKLYLKLCKEEIELKNAKSVFRNIINNPTKAIDKKLSRNLLNDLWKKALYNKMFSSDFNTKEKEKEEDESNNNQNKATKIHCRYNVISPYIHPSSINPIDSESLSQRLNENYELLRFKKIHLKNDIEKYNDQYDPLIKKKRKPFKLISPKYIKPNLAFLNQSHSHNILHIKGSNTNSIKNHEGHKPALLTSNLVLNRNKSSNIFHNLDTNKADKINQLYSVRSSYLLSRNINSTTHYSTLMLSNSKTKTFYYKSHHLKETKVLPNLLSDKKIKNYFSNRDLYF